MTGVQTCALPISPFPTASASASLPPVSCQQPSSRPIARASIISALPSAASGNKLRGAAARAAWPAGQYGVAGLSQRNPKLRSISRSSPRSAGAEGLGRARRGEVFDCFVQWRTRCGIGNVHAVGVLYMPGSWVGWPVRIARSLACCAWESEGTVRYVTQHDKASNA